MDQARERNPQDPCTGSFITGSARATSTAANLAAGCFSLRFAPSRLDGRPTDERPHKLTLRAPSATERDRWIAAILEARTPRDCAST